MLCPSCGATIPDHAQFCTQCGQRVAFVQEAVKAQVTPTFELMNQMEAPAEPPVEVRGPGQEIQRIDPAPQSRVEAPAPQADKQSSFKTVLVAIVAAAKARPFAFVGIVMSSVVLITLFASWVTIPALSPLAAIERHTGLNVSPDGGFSFSLISVRGILSSAGDAVGVGIFGTVGGMLFFCWLIVLVLLLIGIIRFATKRKIAFLVTGLVVVALFAVITIAAIGGLNGLVSSLASEKLKYTGAIIQTTLAPKIAFIGAVIAIVFLAVGRKVRR